MSIAASREPLGRPTIGRDHDDGTQPGSVDAFVVQSIFVPRSLLLGASDHLIRGVNCLHGIFACGRLVGQHNTAPGHLADPEFGAADIGAEGDGPPPFRGYSSHHLGQRLSGIGGAVGHIEPAAVHSDIGHPVKDFWG